MIIWPPAPPAPHFSPCKNAIVWRHPPPFNDYVIVGQSQNTFLLIYFCWTILKYICKIKHVGIRERTHWWVWPGKSWEHSCVRVASNIQILRNFRRRFTFDLKAGKRKREGWKRPRELSFWEPGNPWFSQALTMEILLWMRGTAQELFIFRASLAFCHCLWKLHYFSDFRSANRL